MLLLDLGRTDFDAADRAQKDALAARIRGGPDCLVLCEMAPVITLGRGTRPGAVERVRFPVRSVERGGEATLHLPGQLVVYPVVGLSGTERDLKLWLRRLEGIVIRVLGDFGIRGVRDPERTGVWVEGPRGGKICSIGVAVRRWTSYHGFALNVDPDLSAFGAIRPCGLDPARMTSMARVLGAAPDFEEVKHRTVARAVETLETRARVGA
ncbi:MAG: lipoyl(octanoyl) transferase LipB [Planctomycetes bacterium]|nr:lipoyl(octanoyl) transferase LipB [Planctomycetota bacterium]